MKRWLSLLNSCVLIVLLVGCARPRKGYVEIVLDTDIDRRFAVTLAVRVVPLADPNASLRDAGSDARRDGALDDGSSAMDAQVMDAGVLRDAGSDAASSLDGGDPFGSLDVLAVDPAVRSFQWTRQGDGGAGGITFPASFSVLPIEGAADGTPVLIEVQISTDGDNTAANPPLRWSQYAIARPYSGQHTVLRMFLSSRCNAPVRGCTEVPDRACRVDQYCADRGKTCGDDGQCVSAAALPQWRAEDARESCRPGECGPRCAPCAAGSTCTSAGRCEITDRRAVACLDRDRDGYGVGSQCFGEDCDDNDRTNFPGNVEYCDEQDNNCDRAVDEQNACESNAGRSCANPIEIDLTERDHAVYNGDTRWGGTLLEPACRFSGHEGGEGRERWFRVRYPSNQEIDLRSVTSMAHGTDTVLLAFNSCVQGSLIACNDDVRERANSGSRVVLHPSPTADGSVRELWVAVDSWSRSTEGPFRFEASRRADVERSCASGYDTTIGGTFAGVFPPGTDARLLCSPPQRWSTAHYRIRPGAYDYALQASVPDRRSIVALGGDIDCAPSDQTPCVLSERMTEEDINYLVADPRFDGWMFVEGEPLTPYMLNISGVMFTY